MADSSKALALAIEVLTRQIADLNATLARSGAPPAGGAAGGGGGNPGGFFDRGGNAFYRAASRLTDKTDVVAASFGRVLGPLATFGTLLNSSASGTHIFGKSIELLANSAGRVLMPVFYSLSVGTVLAAEKIGKELAPAMDGWTKLILNTAIPAMVSFANLVGKATAALVSFSDSALGKATIGSDTQGGRLGALDRLTGGGDVERANKSGTTLEGGMGRIKQVERVLADLGTSIGGEGVGSKADWFAKKWGTNVVNPLTGQNMAEDDYSIYGGKGTNKTSAPETKKAMNMVLAEFQMSMGGRAGVGSGAASIYAKAQAAGLGMSPFETENLKILREQLAALRKNVKDEPPPGRT